MGFLSGLVDTVFGGGNEKAAKSEMAGYDRSNALMRPYQQGGQEDYNSYRNVIGQYGAETGKYGNPYEWMWKQAGLDPQQFLTQLMSGYDESPMAKYNQEQAMKAATQGASASGMLGSGALLKGLQRNAYDISAQDQDRYLNNVLGVNRRQMEYGSNLQGERDNYRGSLAGLANLGPQMSMSMGQNEIGKGRAQGDADRARAGGWQNLIGAGMSFLPGGSAARMLMNR